MRVPMEVNDNVQREGVILIDASTLGFPPGVWPESLEVGKDNIETYRCVGKVPTLLLPTEVSYAIYVNDKGDIMKVFND